MKRVQKGFTFAEILIVMGLIALIVAAISINIKPLIETLTQKSPSDIVIKAAREARYQAMTQVSTAYLSFDKKSRRFVIWDETLTRSLDEMPAHEDIKACDFVPITPNRGIGSPYEYLQARSQYEQMRFSADGSASPCQIELTTPRGKDVFILDPFSSNIVYLDEHARKS